MPPKRKDPSAPPGSAETAEDATSAVGESKVGPPLAINGFRDDVSVLLSLFLEKNSFRFEAFVQVWEEMKFGFIYSGLPTLLRGLTELHEFAEKCLREAVMLCLPSPSDPINRVAGIYLLYCLYISRPLHCYAKIRIHPKIEMAPVVSFVEELVEHKHYDSVYCFLELYEQNAFCYTLTPREMGSHTQRSKAWRDDSSIRMYIPDVPKLLTSEDFAKVLDADKVYARTKEELLTEIGQSAENQIEPSQFDFVVEESLRNRLQLMSDEYEKDMRSIFTDRTGSQLDPDEPGVSSSTIQGEEDTIGQKRQRLRQQQMSRNVQNC